MKKKKEKELRLTLGNSPSVNTHNSEVLPHAPSPTMTIFLFSIEIVDYE